MVLNMKRFVDGVDRPQGLLLPDRLEDYVHEDNPVRVVDAFVEALDLGKLGFDAVNRAVGGRPAYHPAALLKIYIYGYLNRIQSSRRLEREAQRNLELIWLTGRLAPDFKTIADFRKDNGGAITAVCSRFIALCRTMKVFSQAVVAIDGSKLKAVNSRDRNYTVGKVKARRKQLDESVARYLAELDRADRDPTLLPEGRVPHLKDKLAKLREQMEKLDAIERQLQDAPDHQISLTDPDARSMTSSGRGTGAVGYNVQAAVDAEHHLIVAHDVTNAGNDRAQLATMAKKARAASCGGAKADCGACLRHAQIVARNHATAGEDPSEGPNRGELGGTCLQHEADDQDHGSAGDGAGHRGLIITNICRSACCSKCACCRWKIADNGFLHSLGQKLTFRIQGLGAHAPAEPGTFAEGTTVLDTRPLSYLIGAL